MHCTVTITPDATLGGARVSFAYDPDLVSVIKTLHSAHRRWNATTKTWWVATAAINELTEILEAGGYTVISTMRSRSSSPPPPRSPRDTWADLLLDAVGQERVEPVHRALSRVLHPDVGGDTALMQALNAARDRRVVRR